MLNPTRNFFSQRSSKEPFELRTKVKRTYEMTLIVSTSLQLSVRRVGDLLLGVGAHADEVGDDLHGVHQALEQN